MTQHCVCGLNCSHRYMKCGQVMIVLLCLLVSTMGFELTLQTCARFQIDPGQSEGHWQDMYYPSFFFRSLSTIWVVLLGVYLALVARTDYTSGNPVRMAILYAVAIGYALMLCFVGIFSDAARGDWDASNFAETYKISCWYHDKSQVWVGVIMDFVLILGISALFIYIRSRDVIRKRQQDQVNAESSMDLAPDDSVARDVNPLAVTKGEQNNADSSTTKVCS